MVKPWGNWMTIEVLAMLDGEPNERRIRTIYEYVIQCAYQKVTHSTSSSFFIEWKHSYD